MIDFNHNSHFVPGRAAHKSDPKPGELINALIDAALEQERSQQPEREYIGMSELGDECLRRVYYNAEKAPRKEHKGSRLRIFETGHTFEAMVARWLIQAGFDLRTKNGKGDPIGMATASGNIQGHVDGYLLTGPAVPTLMYPGIWENKALANKYWKPIVKNGLRIAEPRYYGQVQTYMGYFETANCLFSAINKDTEEIYWEIIRFYLSEAQRFSDRGVAVIQALHAGVPPDRICPNMTFFEARMCDFAEFCFRDER
jgi:hypothetical protein